ncbi:DUF6892 domain-containing protein [Umezawaea sp. NPDC059074]|uniref:DUF6892 domain-containing protein n=1 Tax=Umezawaea sp. NPDC059074 TaxID=3346716 RepID=UPI003685073B
MADFQDFNLKLVVVDKLMYVDGTLTPRFDIAELLRDKGLGNDPWMYAYDNDLAYQVLPQARDHFEALEIGDDLLAGVEELVMDGGLRVYAECSPVWDGEDDLFDVAALDDLALLPNLRRVLGSEFLGKTLRDDLRARGIAAD